MTQEREKTDVDQRVVADALAAARVIIGQVAPDYGRQDLLDDIDKDDQEYAGWHRYPSEFLYRLHEEPGSGSVDDSEKNIQCWVREHFESCERAVRLAGTKYPTINTPAQIRAAEQLLVEWTPAYLWSYCGWPLIHPELFSSLSQSLVHTPIEKPFLTGDLKASLLTVFTDFRDNQPDLWNQWQTLLSEPDFLAQWEQSEAAKKFRAVGSTSCEEIISQCYHTSYKAFARSSEGIMITSLCDIYPPDEYDIPLDFTGKPLEVARQLIEHFSTCDRWYDWFKLWARWQMPELVMQWKLARWSLAHASAASDAGAIPTAEKVAYLEGLSAALTSFYVASFDSSDSSDSLRDYSGPAVLPLVQSWEPFWSFFLQSHLLLPDLWRGFLLRKGVEENEIHIPPFGLDVPFYQAFSQAIRTNIAAHQFTEELQQCESQLAAKDWENLYGRLQELRNP